MRQHSPFISSIVKYYVNHQNETIGFVHKSLRNAVFARENENYVSDADRHVAVKSILKANQQHSLKLRRVNIDYQTLTKQHRCPTRYRILQPFTSNNKAHRNRFKPRDGSLFLPPSPPKNNKNKTTTTKCLLNFRELNTVKTTFLFLSSTSQIKLSQTTFY